MLMTGLFFPKCIEGEENGVQKIIEITWNFIVFKQIGANSERDEQDTQSFSFSSLSFCSLCLQAGHKWGSINEHQGD